MANQYHHEELYRGANNVAQLADVSVVLCGAGALGSHLADTLARQGFRRLRVIDFDRIEEHNSNTQLYDADDVGVFKTEVLANRLFRAVGVEIETVRKELKARNVDKLLRGADVVIDAFDNSDSRRIVQQHCQESSVPCLHVGLFSDYGEIVWNQQYRVPGDVQGDVCDYPLARNLVMLTVAISAETVVRHVLDGSQESRTVTLGDFAVQPLAAPLVG